MSLHHRDGQALGSSLAAGLSRRPDHNDDYHDLDNFFVSIMILTTGNMIMIMDYLTSPMKVRVIMIRFYQDDDDDNLLSLL